MAKPAIIFISDIHFCDDVTQSQFQKNDANNYYQIWETSIEKIIASKDIIPKYLVISGDLVESARKREYKVVLKLLNDFCERFNILHENVLIIPGNHDIDWPKLADHCDENDIDPNMANELFNIKLAHYAEFYKEFKGRTLEPENAILDSIDVQEESLTILGLNSLVKESFRKTDHVGYVNVSKLKKELEEYIEPDKRIFVVTHHSLADTYERELPSLEHAGIVKEALGTRGITTFIYGHHHISESKVQLIGDHEDKIRILEIGTLGKIIPNKNGESYTNRFTIAICEEEKWVLTDYAYSVNTWEERINPNYVHELYIDEPLKAKADAKETDAEENLPSGVVLPVADTGDVEKKKHGEIPTTLPVTKVTLYENADFLYEHLKNGNYKEGHFHWKDNKKTRGWINVTSFIGNMDILSKIKDSIMKMYREHMKGVDTVIGYGIEGTVIGSSLVDFWIEKDIKFYSYPSVHKGNEHIDFEKSLWDDESKDVLVLFDILPSDTYLNEILSSNEKLKACKNVYVLALFVNPYLLNDEKVKFDKNIKRYALAEVDVEVCNKKDDECMVCKNQLSKIITL